MQDQWIEMSYNRYNRDKNKEIFNIDSYKYYCIHYYDFKEDNYEDDYNPLLKEITDKEVKLFLERY